MLYQKIIKLAQRKWAESIYFAPEKAKALRISVNYRKCNAAKNKTCIWCLDWTNAYASSAKLQYLLVQMKIAYPSKLKLTR